MIWNKSKQPADQQDAAAAPKKGGAAAFAQKNWKWLVLVAIVVIGLYLGFKREFTKLIGFLVVAMLSVGLVFNAAGVKDVLLSLFNQILGA